MVAIALILFFVWLLIGRSMAFARLLLTTAVFVWTTVEASHYEQWIFFAWASMATLYVIGTLYAILNRIMYLIQGEPSQPQSVQRTEESAASHSPPD